jgi:hypothetical protein
MIRVMATIGLLVAAVFCTGLERLICRSVLPAGGLAVMAAVDGVRRADCQLKAPALWENRGLDGEIAGSWGAKRSLSVRYPNVRLRA